MSSVEKLEMPTDGSWVLWQYFFAKWTWHFFFSAFYLIMTYDYIITRYSYLFIYFFIRSTISSMLVQLSFNLHAVHVYVLLFFSFI